MLVNCFLLWLVHCRGCSCPNCTNKTVGYCLVGALQGGAAVPARLCRLPEQGLHQQSCWAADWLVHCKGVQLSQLGFAACQSKNCTNRAVGLLIGWCTARGCSCLSCTNRAVGLLIGWCT